MSKIPDEVGNEQELLGSLSKNSVESAMCVLFKSKTVLFLNFLLCTILEKTRNKSRGATSELLFAFSIIISNSSLLFTSLNSSLM